MFSVFQSFKRNDRGAIAVIFAFCLVLLGVCVGGAVDFARYSSAKAQTSAALDAAVLAGARTLLMGGTAATAKAAAQQYYAKNVVDRFDVTSDTVTFSVTDSDSAISGSGNAHLPTTFLQLAGINSLPLVSGGGSQFPKAKINGGGGGDIEVSVMLDLTGSMCGSSSTPCTSSTKLDALKTGATDLVNIVVQADQSTYKSRVALVPFGKRIRVAQDGAGAGIMASMTGLNSTWNGWVESCQNWTPGTPSSDPEGGNGGSCGSYQLEQVSNWKVRPCVTERFFDSSSSIEATDTAPGNNFWLNAYEGRRRPLSNDSGNNAPTSGLGVVSTDPSSHHNYNSSGSCGTPEENVIVPLTSDKSSLLSAISNLKAVGPTAGALGTAFSWYMLSPKWNSLWTSTSHADPYAHLSILQPNGRPKLRKVAILMSDGVFNTYRSWTGQNQQTMSDHAKDICTAMKAAGVEIYSIGFDLDSLPSSEKAIAIDTLQSCGTSIDHFYNTLDAQQLQTAFQDIAITLSSISLTQ